MRRKLWSVAILVAVGIGAGFPVVEIWGIPKAAFAQTINFETGWEDGQEQGGDYRALYAQNVTRARVERFTGRGHRGSHALLIAGQNGPSPSYSYHLVFNRDFLVQRGMKISYWIFPEEGSGKIAVDGHFIGGGTIRDFGGGLLKAQHGVRIHPGHRREPRGEWTYVEVDLSPAAGKTLDFIIFAFDHGRDPNGGSYRTYIDDFRIFVGETYGQYIPLWQRKAGIMARGGQRAYQWAYHPIRGMERTRYYWGDYGHWPPGYNEEFGFKEDFGGRAYVWQYAFLNDHKGVRYNLRATRVLLEIIGQTQEIVNAEPEGIEGLPYALYHIPDVPYTLKVWANIMTADGNSVLRRCYWQVTWDPPGDIHNAEWKGEGSKTQPAIRLSELWWDSDNGWMHGGSQMGGECSSCADCRRAGGANCSQPPCTRSSCAPTGGYYHYGRTYSHARNIGWVWTYDNLEANDHGGLETVWPW